MLHSDEFIWFLLPSVYIYISRDAFNCECHAANAICFAMGRWTYSHSHSYSIYGRTLPASLHMHQTNSIALPSHNKRKRWLTRFMLRFCAQEANMQWPSEDQGPETRDLHLIAILVSWHPRILPPPNLLSCQQMTMTRPVASECRALNATLLLLLPSSCLGSPLILVGSDWKIPLGRF